MRGILMTGLVLSLMAMPAPVSARGLGEAMDLERARANARAGGPVSEHDAYLLERHGCLSGTNSAFCRKLENRKWRHTETRRKRR